MTTMIHDHEQHRVSNESRDAPQRNTDDARGSSEANVYLDNDRDLSRVGFWFLSMGGLGVVIGFAFLLAGGILPGAFVAAIALLCAFVGALALGLVAHHQG